MTFHPKCSLTEDEASAMARFEQEVLALRPALCAFARRLARQESDAEDLVQDTILRALAARARFREGSNLKAWLFTIMRNAFNTGWRRSRRETLPGPEAIEAGVVTPALQGTGLWARETMGRLLHDLSPAHREILILVPVLGLGYEEAAEVCGCSVGTIKSRLSRARAALAVLAGEAGP
ncbi:RNA polymerase, sigma-24 subunit, ECF subfamily [Rubellimicrobium mesophilum DSM 19309]|uniref:RNA polymerase sigma factor n=1 Tax=Rubellimicrobium mesophilum DSM 19309 TaxID=442562 RepID=A0A017HRE1_9RHOB|nr:sigma-70 family RNA polymerase sigma factor [Rubellimicrobium mesophilum]EYD76941.1 RNA polymerase, sigma-24 subunit, ECF subfamily [Rubellimicrobium mesophilum DSM 19309]